MNKSIIFYGAAACILLSGSVISATQSTITPQNVFKIGPGFLIKDEAYKGVGTNTYLIPLIVFRNEYLTFSGKELSLKLYQEENISCRALLSLRTEGYEDDDSSDLAGMKDRRLSLDGGLGLSLVNDWFVTDFTFLADISGTYKGYETSGKISHPFENAFGVQMLTLNPFAGLAWRSDNLNNYYYGVRTAEARAGRPAYLAGNGFDPFAGVSVNCELSEQWSVYFLWKTEWLSSEITDSPIVSKDYTMTYFGGVMYRF